MLPGPSSKSSLEEKVSLPSPASSSLLRCHDAQTTASGQELACLLSPFPHPHPQPLRVTLHFASACWWGEQSLALPGPGVCLTVLLAAETHCQRFSRDTEQTGGERTPRKSHTVALAGTLCSSCCPVPSQAKDESTFPLGTHGRGGRLVTSDLIWNCLSPLGPELAGPKINLLGL